MSSPNIKKKINKKSLLGYNTSRVPFLLKLHEYAARNKCSTNYFLSQYINIDRNETSVRRNSSYIHNLFSLICTTNQTISRHDTLFFPIPNKRGVKPCFPLVINQLAPWYHPCQPPFMTTKGIFCMIFGRQCSVFFYEAIHLLTNIMKVVSRFLSASPKYIVNSSLELQGPLLNGCMLSKITSKQTLIKFE